MNPFRPNKAASASQYNLIIIVWVVMAVLTWASVPMGLIPGPIEVFFAFIKLCTTGNLLSELISSYVTNLTAIALTTIVSLAISYISVLPAMRPVGAVVSKMRFLGFTGLPFLFTLLFPTGHDLKIALLMFGMTVFFVTSMMTVVNDVTREKLDHARTIGMSEWRVVWEVIILGTRDQAIELMRQNAAMGWMMLTMVEGLVRGEGGIGVLLINQNRYLNLAGVIAIQFVVLFVGLLQDMAFQMFKSIISPYATLRTEKK